jgi:hypothetical protein
MVTDDLFDPVHVQQSEKSWHSKKLEQTEQPSFVFCDI